MFSRLVHRHLKELDLQENEVQVRSVGWLTAFPES
uniref:Uncharacterized protein n=1 Tax=Physcomitrium patens TaxID=3218 RepID=A0A2K1KXB6_PHYPA|nr:hypothetical protein PHYPA_005422 [Physcomitrium patens]